VSLNTVSIRYRNWNLISSHHYYRPSVACLPTSWFDCYSVRSSCAAVTCVTECVCTQHSSVRHIATNCTHCSVRSMRVLLLSNWTEPTLGSQAGIGDAAREPLYVYYSCGQSDSGRIDADSYTQTRCLNIRVAFSIASRQRSVVEHQRQLRSP